MRAYAGHMTVCCCMNVEEWPVSKKLRNISANLYKTMEFRQKVFEIMGLGHGIAGPCVTSDVASAMDSLIAPGELQDYSRPSKCA